MVTLFTGKAGAGKTYLGEALTEKLIKDGRRAVHIDGDKFRDKRNNDDYTDTGRIRNLSQAAELARDLENQGYEVVLSFVAPRSEWRDMMRKNWKRSRVIYVPGGTLWSGTKYDIPDEHEFEIRETNE